MTARRTLVALLVAAALSLPILAARPATGPDQRAAALVPPLPSLPLPLPSLPLPTLPPLLTDPPPVPSLPIPLATPSPTPRVAATPSSAPSAGPGALSTPRPSDARVPPIITAGPPAGGGGETAVRPEAPAIAPAGPVKAGTAPGAFDGVVGPVVALGVSALLALLVLLAQLLGGAAFVPVVRRTLGDLRLRRWPGDSSAPPPGGDVPRG